MNSVTQCMNDKDFIEQFQNLTLDPKYFDHLGHMRLAWIYLQDEDVDKVVRKVCSGIKAYAESLGATDKFHFTITDAIVRIMAMRLGGKAGNSWQSFIQENTDLVSNAQSVLQQHYSESILLSNEARVSILPPDLKSI